MKKKIITIGRQCGSGGHAIGKILAERLSIPFYDKEIIKEVSKRSGLTEEIIEKEGEYATSGFLFNLANGVYNNYDLTKRENLVLNEQVNAYQTDFIREIADKGACVIVGRCADYILSERTDCLNVFIYGDIENRVQRVISEQRVMESDARLYVKNRDKNRANHYKYITNQTWGDASNYNLCLDSSCLGIEKCIEIILSCVNVE